MARKKPSRKLLFPKAIRKTVFSAMEHNVWKSAAALTYYLLFAMFPLLIFISNLLGFLDLNVTSITNVLLPVMPDDVVYLLEAYLNYVENNSNPVLFWFSLVFTVWFPMQAVSQLMDDVRLAYQLEKPARPLRYYIRQLLFTLVFLVIIVLTFLLAVLGRRFVSTVSVWLGIEHILNIPPVLLNLWQYLRFILLAAVMFAVLGFLYAASQDQRQPAGAIVPGAAAAMAAWMLISIGFSIYVENIANYSVIYGTLGAVIVLLMWLYMTSFILIIGAEFNAARMIVRKKTTEASETNKKS